MRPAFSSRRALLAFVSALALCLAAPVLVARTGSLARRDVYPPMPVKYGPFAFLAQQIFVEKGDLDIAFTGSSHVWTAVRARFVQEALGRRLGRNANVVTLGWPWGGFDAVYFVVRDLLEHRHVALLVVDDEGNNPEPHVNASRWFLFGPDTEAWSGLGPAQQAALYGSAVLGLPRHLVSLLRADRTEDPLAVRADYWTEHYRAPSFASELGTLRAHIGYDMSPAFEPFAGHAVATPADARVLGDDTRSDFAFTGPPTSAFQLHFLRKLVALCREHGTRLVLLHTPFFSERAEPRIREREPWPERFGAPFDVLGVPPTRLFAGLSEREIKTLFYQNDHLNQNGQDVFTPLITPALIELHARASRHD